MIRGRRVGLRTRRADDVPALHAHLHDDPVVRSRTGVEPWTPAPVENSPFRPKEPREDVVTFSVVELADQEPLIGAAVLWGIDQHNQLAHIGMSLLPGARGRGLAADVLRLLCEYGFVYRNLRRLQLETLADNAPMIATARALGFTHEGTLRANAWITGMWVDEFLFGLLRDEWTATRSAAPTPDA